MRALVISDIHANLDALEAVLAAAPPHDTVWNLGDSVGYGASPNEVIEAVRALGVVFVRGNHDRACCGLLPLDDFNPIASRAAQWTQETLTAEHTAWLQALAHGPLSPNGASVSVMHGSPDDEDEYLISMRDAWGPLHTVEAQFNFFGHTHVQGGFFIDGGMLSKLAPSYKTRNGAEQCEIKLKKNGRYLINPGSIGQPRDNDWRAACALFDEDRNTISFLRIPYDVRSAQIKIIRAGLPDRLAYRLREGR
jgi:predicted phosphodiesterase